MLAKVYSAAVCGVEAFGVEVEVNAGAGLSAIVIVGLPDAAVKESRDRVTTAISNSAYRWPQGRTTVNLAPADVKKEGPSFDLPIAVAMIAAGQDVHLEKAAEFFLVGELALTGAVRPVRGVLPIAMEARKKGRKGLLVPEANAAEASVVEGLVIHPVRTLRQAYEFLAENEPIPAHTPAPREAQAVYDVDFSDVKGQHAVKRAIEIGVTGNHNLLLIGPPGSGKSMLAKRIPTIIPSMSLEEAIETTKIHSICGLLDPSRAFVGTRPFRAPHHTISDIGLLGGSANPSPGEVSLAHNGVLFLDELPEFRRSTLEVLRQPLEDSKILISRAAGSMTFPADFMLVAAMNPCPCGYFGDPKHDCRCSSRQVQQYRQRISGPLLDRIDMHVEVSALAYDELASSEPAEPSADIRQRVEQGRAVQFARFDKAGCNARMTSKQIRAHCRLDDASQETLRLAMGRLHFSARAYDRILKVARTIADLDSSERIRLPHLSEAIQYRSLDRSLWL